MPFFLKAGRTESGALYLAIVFRRNGLPHSALFLSPYNWPIYVVTE